MSLALINSGLAHGKHRGPGWFVASLLLGPVATLLIVMPSPAARQVVDG